MSCISAASPFIACLPSFAAGRFFKWYGGTYRNVLRNFDHIFVQNERSKRYLAKIGINRVTVVGDTRFDRVLQIREEAKDLPLVELFKNNTMTFVAGSSWQPDEDLFIEYFNQHPEVKLIIAPHVIDENHLVEIIRKLEASVCALYPCRRKECP